MAIKGATFDLQTVLAKYDGAMYNALSNNHDGYVSWTGSGNPITFTDTNVLTLKNGYILVHGRLIVVDGATDITLNPGSSISSGDGRLVLQIDTSRTNTQTVLNQVEILQEYKATGSSWRALSTDDINALSTGVYEVQLCHFTVANGTSSGVQIDISTDTLIGNLQADIETLADNLEQTASDVGDLMALGLSVPVPVNKGGSGLTSNPSMLTNLASSAAAGIFQASPRPGVTGTLPIANGGTGASSVRGAQQNLSVLPIETYTTSDPISLASIGAMYTAIGHSAYAIATFNGIGVKALINYENAQYGTVVFWYVRTYEWVRHEYIYSLYGGIWRDSSTPPVVQFHFEREGLSKFGYQNLAVTSRTDILGNPSFTDATSGYWNIQLQPGVYRMFMQASFQSSAATDTDVGLCIGNNANRRLTPLDVRTRTTGSITRLAVSGIIQVTNYSDLYSFLVYQGDTTSRDIAGYWAIEMVK